MSVFASRLFLCLGFLFSTLTYPPAVFAEAMKCAVCGMNLEEHARNHIQLSRKSDSQQRMHVCSLACAKKALKHDAGYDVVEVQDFNHPEKTLSGDSAFFLIKSEKIRSDLGDMVMSPYFGAYASKAEADNAQKKYGDGTVVEGIKNALK